MNKSLMTLKGRGQSLSFIIRYSFLPKMSGYCLVSSDYKNLVIVEFINDNFKSVRGF